MVRATGVFACHSRGRVILDTRSDTRSFVPIFLPSSMSIEPWYTKSLRSVDRNDFLSVLRTFHRKSAASSTAIREGPWAPNQAERDYDAVVKAWRTEKGKFPFELPGLRPEDHASRIAFWSMVENILNRTPVELVEYAPHFFFPFREGFFFTSSLKQVG